MFNMFAGGGTMDSMDITARGDYATPSPEATVDIATPHAIVRAYAASLLQSHCS
jgi:hypothetical protein